MQFSINYSIETAELLRGEQIRVDRLKCADWPDMIETASALAPVYVHFPFDVGTSNGRAADVARAEAMCRQTDTPFVNYHIVSYTKDYPGVPRDSLDEGITSGILRKAAADTRAAVEAFGRERVIVENIPWFGAGGDYHRPSVEPGLMHELIRETGAGFLLDISHARIAAHYLGVEAHAYIESLPVAHLRELHITGVQVRNDRLVDHMELGDEDWAFLEWALERIRRGRWARPWMVAFEYGGIGEPFKWRSRREVIEAQVPRLYEAVHAAD